MQKVLLLSGMACLVAANASAYMFNPYISAKAKYDFTHDNIKIIGDYEGKVKVEDEVFGGSVALGMTSPATTGDFRYEIEYTKNGDAEKNFANGKIKVKTQAVLFNVYYDLNMGANVPFKPYAGIGLGWGHAEFSTPAKKIKDDGVAMQIGAGLGFRCSQNLVLDLGYRFMTYGDFDETYHVQGRSYQKYEYKPRAHEILLGARYQF